MDYRNGVYIYYSKEQKGQSTLLDRGQLYTACFERPTYMDFCLKIFRFGVKMFSSSQTFSIHFNIALTFLGWLIVIMTARSQSVMASIG